MKSAMSFLKRKAGVLGLSFTAFLVSWTLLSAPSFAQIVTTTENSYSSYAISKEGNLYVWGRGNYGELGDGNTTKSNPTLFQVPFPTGVTAWDTVVAGRFHTVAIANNGEAFGWGRNDNGELGIGTTSKSVSTPTLIPFPAGVTGWVQATAAAFNTLLLGNNGKLYACGRNGAGELGDSTLTQSDTLVQVLNWPTGVTPVQLSASGHAFLVLGSDGNIYVWGENSSDELGLGQSNTILAHELTPVAMPMPSGVTRWTTVISGNYFNGAMGNDGNLYEWGSNGGGVIGNIAVADTDSPVKMPMPSGVTSWSRMVVCGADFIFAQGSNGKIYAWGDNSIGQLGIGDTSSFTPNPVALTLPSDVTSWEQLNSGNGHTLALGSNGYIYAWGNNQFGELGISGVSDTTLPVKVYGWVPSPLVAPALVAPVNNATGMKTTVTLEWNKAAEASQYQCEVSTDPTFTTAIVVDDSAIADTADTITGLGTSTPYYWRVRSFDNGVFSSYSTTDTFTTIMKAPSKPSLLLPADDAVNQPAKDTLVCSSATGASQYHWEVSTDIGFSNFVVDDSTNDTSNVVTLMGGTKYYWRASGVNPGGESQFAGPDSFTVMAVPKAPVLTSPANNATFQRADTLTLQWSASSGADGYSVQLSDSLSFSPAAIVLSQDSLLSTSDTLTKLKNLHKYYWRVAAYDAGGLGIYSSPDSFTTKISVPTIPTLVSPAVNATGIARETVFNWKAASLAKTYEIQIASKYNIYSSGDSIGAFLSQNIVFDTTVTDTSLKLSAPLLANTEYYWHVEAFDTAGGGGYSNSPLHYFKTGTGLTAVESQTGIPKNFVLSQNYPNPFNPT